MRGGVQGLAQSKEMGTGHTSNPLNQPPPMTSTSKPTPTQPGTDALQELGTFYQKNGPRSRLTAEAAAGIRQHLDAVESALPSDKKGLLGI